MWVIHMRKIVLDDSYAFQSLNLYKGQHMTSVHHQMNILLIGMITCSLKFVFSRTLKKNNASQLSAGSELLRRKRQHATISSGSHIVYYYRAHPSESDIDYRKLRFDRVYSVNYHANFHRKIYLKM